MAARKKDYTSLPFAQVRASSLETAVPFEPVAELELWFSGLGLVKFEFQGRTDIAYPNRLLAHHVL